MPERSRAWERYTKAKRGLVIASTAFYVLAGQASAMPPAGVRAYLQESGAGAPVGKLSVAPEVMEGHCITKVSPIYPQTDGTPRQRATVVVRVVIWKSGDVSPMRVVSGPASLEDEAMNTVRRWHYKPFVRDGEPIDVTTEIRVNFDPGKPGGIVTHLSH